MEYLSSKPDDISNRCIFFEAKGECPYGLQCRFGKQHTSDSGKLTKLSKQALEEYHAKLKEQQPLPIESNETKTTQIDTEIEKNKDDLADNDNFGVSIDLTKYIQVMLTMLFYTLLKYQLVNYIYLIAN